MKRKVNYRRRVLTFLALIVGAYILNICLLYTVYKQPTPDTRWVNDLYRVKEQYALSVDAPKVVYVAGSSGHYSFQAARMEAELGIPVANMATHGDLRDYSLSRAKRVLKENDLVILAPEYSQYNWDSPTAGVKSRYILNFDKGYLRQMPVSEQLQIIKAKINPYQVFSGQIRYHFFRDAKEKKRAKRDFGRTLNVNGDETKNQGTKKRRLKPVSFSENFHSDAYVPAKMLEFVAWCRDRNITVIAMWPPTLEPSRKIGLREQQFFQQIHLFWEDAGVPIMGEAPLFFYPRDQCYDSVYHLNQTGAKRHTVSVIGLLREQPVFINWFEAQHAELPLSSNEPAH
ncbi:hypothetical protein [Coraliomargarita parva]|uniref:hypothetical protein n=1 Tax=Coraliomargarita parva TaxID=3014050 RepID=UPI0022B33128|nr:hypothetical protein [Coraliomargarita parva]